MDFDLITVVEWATVIVSFILMASGFPVCVNMYKTKSTRNVPYLLFLISSFVSALCLQYGMLVKNHVLVLINSVALLVWGTFVSVYILVARSKTNPVLKLLAVLALYWAHLYYLRTLPKSETVATMGVYSVVWCTLVYLIPVGDIITMVKEKSAECCDIPLLLGGTLSAAVWYLYGILVEDVYIYMPSVPALIVSGIKFLLMFIYGTPAKKVMPRTEFGDKDVGTDFHKEIYKINSRHGIRHRN